MQRGGCLGGCLVKLLAIVVLCGVGVYAVVGIMAPWAFHIGGRWTPFLTWRGTGQLHTKSGVDYPLYVYFYPSSSFSHLRLDGLRPTGGLKGVGWLCTSRGVTQRLDLSGTIYGGWRSTDGSVMSFRLLEPKNFDIGQGQGFFDLYGKWHGAELVMDGRGRIGEPFRSGLRIEQQAVALDWGTYSDFKAACANATNFPPHR
jgi:hypothetical protein